MDLMRDGFLELVEQTTGVRPTMGDPTPAPENERSGSA
jgi:hypothetical protein